MKKDVFEEFIKKRATKENLCYKYFEYSEQVQKMLKRIHATCFRFGLYSSQIVYMLDQALIPFDRKRDLFEMLED